MDFFASQDAARKKTKLLILYFALAVVGLILSLYTVFLFVEHWGNKKSSSRRSSVSQVSARNNRAQQDPPFSFWEPQLFLWSSIGTLVSILIGSGYKTMQLSAGGGVVARDLGGRLVDRDSRDPDERKLLNVVEEMSIAAGMPVPDVYLLEGEDGINAFAAGNTPGDAVIGVTSGCMKTLSRDELQGVMAHEFSHILNGDMKLNFRLIGLVHGILIIALIGRLVLRLALETRSNDSKGNGAKMGFVVLGAAVMALGYLGVFFGQLIKAAISRQREYLADASAVQFTRNPEGIAGALKKIGGISGKSYLRSPNAEEASHMMFGASAKSSAFDSHPPLEDRIKRIAPHWDGTFPVVAMAAITSENARPPLPGMPGGLNPMMAAGMGAVLGSPPPLPKTEMNLGQLNSTDLTRAAHLRAAIPAHWKPLLNQSSSAQSMMFALILSQDDDLRESEITTLKGAVDERTLALTLELQPQVAEYSSTLLIAVIDLAIPALRRLSPEEYGRFIRIMDELMASDQKIDLFEFMVQKILRRHLDLWFQKSPPPGIQYTKIEHVLGAVGTLVSTLANVSGDPAGSFAAGAKTLSDHGANISQSDDAGNWDALDQALDQLEKATPLVKKQILFACGQTVMADGELKNEEAELLRAIADTIGCPIPPFVSI